MPWYMNPASSRKVVNRIASRYSRASLQELGSALDLVTQRLWSKQEFFCDNFRRHQEMADLQISGKQYNGL